MPGSDSQQGSQTSSSLQMSRLTAWGDFPATKVGDPHGLGALTTLKRLISEFADLKRIIICEAEFWKVSEWSTRAVGETASARWRCSEGSPRDLACTRKETSHAQAQEGTPRKQQVGLIHGLKHFGLPSHRVEKSRI